MRRRAAEPDDPKPELPPRGTSRRLSWELVVALIALGGIAAALVDQLLVRPIVGLANNGDFERIMFQFGFYYRTESFEDKYFSYVNVDFAVGHPFAFSHYLSSQELTVGVAWVATHLFSPDNFDLRLLGALNGALLLAGVALLLRAARPLGFAALTALAALLLLILTDVGYVAYLNSFYSEPASLLFFLLAFAAALGLVLDGGRRLRWLWYGAFLASVVVLATAKAQNAPVGLLFIPLAWALAPTSDRRVRAGIALALVGLTVWYGLFTTPRPIRESNLYNAVFYEILRTSDDREADVRSLGLDSALVSFAGSAAADPDSPIADPEFRKAFFERIGLADVGKFYVQHPGRFVDLAGRTAPSAFLLRPTFLGNFERSAGHPKMARSQSYDWWSDFEDRVLPRSAWFLGLFALANLAAALAVLLRAGSRQGRLVAGLHLTALAIVVSQFVVASIGEGELDAVKHFFLLHVAADACFAFLVLYAVVAASRLRFPRPRAGGRAEAV